METVVGAEQVNPVTTDRDFSPVFPQLSSSAAWCQPQKSTKLENTHGVRKHPTSLLCFAPVHSNVFLIQIPEAGKLHGNQSELSAILQ